MVKIQFIRTTSCPTCGCSIISAESVEIDKFNRQIREHSCGGHWEYREFACGFKVHYCPNFGKEEVLRKCDFDPEELKIKNNQEKLKISLAQEIEKGDCSKAYKERLLNAIKYV